MLPRFDTDATRAFEDARALARHYQHDIVDIDHLLLALLGLRNEVPLLIDGVSMPELVTRLDAQLAARPHTTLYRDAAITNDVPLSEGVETVLRRAAAGRGLAFFRAITAYDLFVTLLMDPALAALAVASGIETDELEQLLEQAKMHAVARGHYRVTVDHVLAPLVDTSWFAAALRAAEASPDRLREVIEARLAAVPRATGRLGRRSPELGDAVRDATSKASLAGETAVTARHFAATISRPPHLAQALVDAGVASLPLLRHLTSGYADPGEDVAGADSRLSVVFHNDDYTTMELVVDLLTQAFDVSPTDATRLMLDIHHHGERTIGTFDAEDARRRVMAARVAAEEAGMPLRISLRLARDSARASAAPGT